MISQDKWQELISIDDKTRNAYLEFEGEAHALAFDKMRALLYELVQINAESNDWAKVNDYPVVDDYPHYTRSREIAKSILEIAGFNGLQKAFKSVKRITASVDESVDNFSLMEFGWQGIGGWQS